MQASKADASHKLFSNYLMYTKGMCVGRGDKQMCTQELKCKLSLSNDKSSQMHNSYILLAKIAYITLFIFNLQYATQSIKNIVL